MQTRSPLKIGMIGGGKRSAVGYAHFSALSLDGVWKLESGVFSRDRDRCLETASQYGVHSSRTYFSAEEFLDQEHGRLDAVAVLTPTPSHLGFVLACLQSGLPVICEKAMVPTFKEGLEIREALNRHSGFASVVFNYACYPMIRALRSMILSGQFGEILHYDLEMPQEGFVRVGTDGKPLTVQAWRKEDLEVPTIYLDLGVHLHHVSNFLLGESPERVWCTQSSKGHFGVIDHVIAVGINGSGPVGNFRFSKSSLGCRNGLRVRIFGTKASADWFQLEPELLRVAGSNGNVQIFDRGSPDMPFEATEYERFKAGHPAGFVESLANFYLETHDSLVKHQSEVSFENLFSAEAALAGIAFCEACVESDRTGSWAEIQSPG